MKILNNNYNIFIDTKSNIITCIDSNSITTHSFETVKSFQDFILQFSPKKVNIYYVGQSINIKQRTNIITPSIIDKLQQLRFEKTRANDNTNARSINIVNNFGLDNIITFESLISNGSISSALQDVTNIIINSQHVIARFIDVGYLAYQFALKSVKFDSYNSTMCIVDISFLQDIYIIEFTAGVPEFIKKIQKEGISDGIAKIKKYCIENSIVNDDYILITDDEAKITNDIKSLGFDSNKESHNLTINEINNFKAPTMPLSVFENIYYNNTIKEYLHHARVITNLKRLGRSLLVGLTLISAYNLHDLQKIKNQKFSYDFQSKQLMKDLDKLQSIKVDEFYVKNFDSLRCIECESKDKINIKRLIARIDDKIENERVNKISFAKNNFAIDLDSDEDIAKKFTDGDFDIFVEKKDDNYKKLSQLDQDIQNSIAINYKIKGKVIR